MQNEYVLIPWDSVHQHNVWYNTEIIGRMVPEYTPTNDSVFSISLETAILGLLVYNIILIVFLTVKNENVLRWEDKTIKKGQLGVVRKPTIHVRHKRKR